MAPVEKDSPTRTAISFDHNEWLRFKVLTSVTSALWQSPPQLATGPSEIPRTTLTTAQLLADAASQVDTGTPGGREA